MPFKFDVVIAIDIVIDIGIEIVIVIVIELAFCPIHELNDYLCTKMQDILDRIIAIEGKLRETMQSLYSANERNKVLTEENQNLHTEKVQLLDQIQDYESRIAIVGKKKGEDSNRDENIVQVKETLRDYISEIDNCIELLKN